MNNNLELQRASAGSGKTYSLARKYLWLYLTIRKDEGNPNKGRRLRTTAELRDSLRHILAVTFTNKATNEMQQRIVEKLYQLAYAKAKTIQDLRKIDYLLDFCKDLYGEHYSQEDMNEFRDTCKNALFILLENYSDFQVSTIDSFFQLVLRTFAYEVDLNDSYGIELDSDFLSKMGVNGIFENVEEGESSPQTNYWLNILMKTNREEQGKWNLFHANSSKGSSYSQFISSLEKLQNEDFKYIRNELEKYFNKENTTKLINLYKGLCEKYDTMPIDPHQKMHKYAEDVKKSCEQWDSDIPPFIKSISDHAKKCLNGKKPNKKPSNSNSNNKEIFIAKQPENFEGTTAKKIRKENQVLFDKISADYINMIAARNEWLKILESEEYCNWKAYKKHFPILGLLSVVLKKREDYLKENNSVELSSTNEILKRIIGEDDTPFIYERLGTILNHFLIDEFQDTSRMQWENFRPLIAESTGYGHENLIIGDAKQSIYRFRNADPTLISSKVENDEAFKGLTLLEGDPSDPKRNAKYNTNYRSDHNVVDFNNRFFEFISTEIENKRLAGKTENTYNSDIDFKKLYGNVVQKVKDDSDRGFISLNFISAKEDKENNIKSDEVYDNLVKSQLIHYINDALDRGFRLGDMAVLVGTNEQSDSIVRSFIEYNMLEDIPRPLEFISEQSLKLKYSTAISIILSVLETIAHGTIQESAPKSDTEKRKVQWKLIQSNFRLYCQKNGGKVKDIAKALEDFLSQESSSDAISEMLSKMRAVTLPALIEGIIANFLEDSLRKENAPYLAAFQDIVLEFCNSHTSDIPTFLDWWKKREDKFSISSPEGMDAINVMTIHKSKGLEFPCIFVPYASATFLNEPTELSKKEWKWVKPDDSIKLDGYEMPPHIPVEVDSNLKQSSHKNEYWKTIEMRTMDKLNSLYVAFTRAEHELYIFTKTNETDTSITYLLKEFIGVRPKEKDYNKKLEPKVIAHAIEKSEGFGEGYETYEIGRRWTQEEIKEEIKKEKEDERENEENGKSHPSIPILGDYKSNRNPKIPKFRDADLPKTANADNAEEDFDNDPRSEGNILHTIMQRVETCEDIPLAVKYFQRKGLYSKEQAQDFEKELLEGLSNQKVSDWFKPGLRVINERAILFTSKETDNDTGKTSIQQKIKRPDRIIVDKDQNAIVIDYKFGRERDDKKYSRQVNTYVNKLKETNLFKSIKGYIWYVRLDEILEVGGN